MTNATNGWTSNVNNVYLFEKREPIPVGDLTRQSGKLCLSVARYGGERARLV